MSYHFGPGGGKILEKFYLDIISYKTFTLSSLIKLDIDGKGKETRIYFFSYWIQTCAFVRENYVAERQIGYKRSRNRYGQNNIIPQRKIKNRSSIFIYCNTAELGFRLGIGLEMNSSGLYDDSNSMHFFHLIHTKDTGWMRVHELY